MNADGSGQENFEDNQWIKVDSGRVAGICKMLLVDKWRKMISRRRGEFVKYMIDRPVG